MTSSTHATTGLAKKVLAVLEQGRLDHELGAALRSSDKSGPGHDPGDIAPYTERGIAELERLHKTDPENLRLIHHLAIAHHSRAWDWELAGDARAANEWKVALDFWRKLQTSGDFWRELKRKYQSCAPGAVDFAWLDETRAGLLEQLLDVHADFICSYAETGALDRARVHVGIVRKAMIPPAARGRLLGKVFQVITSAVPEARARHAYDSALTVVERFLKLFPDYLPALRLEAEVCAQWLAGLSYADDWDLIVSIAGRGRPWAEAQAVHNGLVDEPLAREALHDLGFRFAMLADNRGSSFLSARRRGEQGRVSRDQAAFAFMLGLEWGRLTYKTSSPGAAVRDRFAECVKGRAVLLRELAQGVSPQEAIKLCKEAISILHEAEAAIPGDAGIREDFLAPIEEQLSTLEDLVGLGFSSGGGS